MIALVKNMDAKTGFVFTFKGQPYKTQPRKEFRRLLKLAKIDLGENKLFHVLRHTFASHMVMNGIDLLTVGKILGHRDISTTQIYSHLTHEHVRKAVNSLSFSLQ